MNKSRHKGSFVARTMLLIAPCICITVAFVVACHTGSPTKQSSLVQLSNLQTNNSINYKGVSFTFDPSLAKEVKSETLREVSDSKPCDIVPEHSAFTLVGYPRPRGMHEDDPHIRVFEIGKFRDALHIAGVEMGKNTVPPIKEDWGQDVDYRVKVLKKLVAERPSANRLEASIGRYADTCYGVAQMPFLPEWEACQPFFAHVRYINFKNGKGIFFLTQWETETTQVTNEGLEYAFQGITNDGRYWIYAEFAVHAPVLPQGNEAEVSKWDEKNYLLSYKTKKFQNYLRPVVAELEALSADKFQPNLELFEGLIQSLEVHSD